VAVHSEAISRLSRSLKVLVSGPMREAQTNSVEWDDIEVEDFIRFCQFAYTSDYRAPEPGVEMSKKPSQEKTEPEPPLPSALQDPAVGTWDDPWGSSKKKKTKPLPDSTERAHSKMSKLRKAFESKIYYDNRTWESPETIYQLAANAAPWQDFTPVFLGHARQYILGDKYGIDNLTTLALHKLHKTLIMFHLCDSRIGDILQLIRYTFQNTRESSKDPLRTLVTNYVVTEIDVIGKSADFQCLLEEGGEFVAEFWKFTQQHLL